jgi:hypothetical protein
MKYWFISYSYHHASPLMQERITANIVLVNGHPTSWAAALAASLKSAVYLLFYAEIDAAAYQDIVNAGYYSIAGDGMEKIVPPIPRDTP